MMLRAISRAVRPQQAAAIRRAQATAGAPRAASSWANVPMGPPDPIIGLNVAFREDDSPSKVNVGVGAYRDGEGAPYVLPSVREAERRIAAADVDHEYAGIAGVEPFVDLSLEFAYGEGSAVLAEGRAA